MRGSHLSANGKVEPIFVAAFSFPRSVGDVPNSLARDHKDRAPSYTRITQSAPGRGATINDPSRFWDGDWFNVEVDVEALVGWLQFSIDSERRKQLDRKLSLRLFEYPFWSVETALCWIAIREGLKKIYYGPAGLAVWIKTLSRSLKCGFFAYSKMED